jgi:SOS-response transcriptional repressor LexA
VPSNPAYSEIVLPPEDVTVYGKVVTLLRRM